MRRACRVALQLRLSSACSSSVAGPSRSIVDQQQRRSTVSIGISEKDEKLIQRGEFYGVAATSGRREETARSPELALSRMHEHLRINYRVNPENVMLDLVLRLEKGDADLISLLQRAPERWIPMSIRCCGRALSSIRIENRRAISDRLWTQLVKRDLPISIESINALLRVKLENDEDFNVPRMLKEIEKKRGLVPNQETFHLLLEKLSLTGKTVDNLVREMALRGYYTSDAISHSHLVYSASFRSNDKEANSLLEEASTKFGSEGEELSLGAACVASAANGNVIRLRELLRRSVDDDLRLRLPIESVFEIIWKLSEKTGDDVAKYDDVINEILNRARHPNGFFRFLYREIERHISSSHFHSAMILLEETMRVKDALKNQERNVFAEQLVGRMCRAMVRSRMEREKMMEIANRMATRLQSIPSRFVHDELMLATLTLKDFDIDERFAAFSSLLPVVDPTKERPHLILPLLAFTPNVDARLKLIFRVSSLGYSNLEKLDTNLISTYLLQPMYRRRAWIAGQNGGAHMDFMDEITSSIHSFGVPKSSVWRIMNEWWKMRKEEEKETAIEIRVKPYAAEIQPWLRSEYASIFGSTEALPILPLTKGRLEGAIEKKESSLVLSLLSTHGWPEEVNLSSTASRILHLLLEDQTNANIIKWLNELSAEAASRQEREEEMRTPLDSSHLLKVLRHRVNESRPPAKEVIEMAFELKRLFPQAVYNQDSFMDTIQETNRLIASCFVFKEGDRLTMEGVDGIIQLLKTLMKLDIVVLSQHGEIVTPYCVQKVLQRFGWNSALKLWLEFQSSLSLGNGMIVLLANTLNRTKGADMQKFNIKLVLHKAEASLPPSRIHALFAATLVNTEEPGKREDEAIEYFMNHGMEMTPFDCAIAYRLINAVKFPVTSQYFVRTFPSLCLAYTPLAKNKKNEAEARKMLHQALKFCEGKRAGSLIAQICDTFAKYGIEADANEKKRIESRMEKQQELVNRWIFAPSGFVQARAEQEFLRENEWKKHVRHPTRDPPMPF